MPDPPSEEGSLEPWLIEAAMPEAAEFNTLDLHAEGNCPHIGRG